MTKVTKEALHLVGNRAEQERSKYLAGKVETAPLSTFSFDGKPVRVETDEAGEVWFRAEDVCNALGYGNPRQAIDSHVDVDDVQKLDGIDSLGRTQGYNYVNESGMYSLVLGSRLESSKRFKRWVTSDVLPSIRKTGSYAPEPAYQVPTTYSAALAEASRLAALAEDNERKALAAETRAAELQSLNTEISQELGEKVVTIETMTPKVEVYNAFMASEEDMSVEDFAKLLHTTEKPMFAWLREKGVIFKSGRNATAPADRAGLACNKLKHYEKPDGSRHPYYQCRITPKGVDVLGRRFRKEEEALLDLALDVPDLSGI